MAHIFVVGGRQKPGPGIERKPEWEQNEAGIIIRVNLETGGLEVAVEYVSPPEVCPDKEASILFKTGTLLDHRMYVPTSTEVLTYDLPSFRQIGYATNSAFNDVHHVIPDEDGSLVVANTGLDMVMRVAPDGATVEEWSVLEDEPLWTRFSRSVDYRKVATTKPHHSHPNHVFRIGGHLWVTRPGQRDAKCLSRSGVTIPLGVDCTVHDGLVYRGRVYFTSVDGHLVVVDAEREVPLEHIDLNAIVNRSMPLGWCRGLEVLGGDLVAVGFSRLRPTRWKENIYWIKHRLGGTGWGLQPSRVAVFDLRRRTMEAEYNVEPAGLNSVFSIHLEGGRPI